MPETATLAAVISVAQITVSKRSLGVFTPIARASSSPADRIFSRQRDSSSGAQPSAMGMKEKRTSRMRAPEKLPISQ